MEPDVSKLTNEQARFLALLDIIGHPLAIDLAGLLSPILPGPFLALLPGNGSLGLIEESCKNTYTLAACIPDSVREQIKSHQDARQISDLIDQIISLDVVHLIAPQVLIRLVDQPAAGEEAVVWLKQFTDRAITRGNNHDAYEYLYHLIGRQLGSKSNNQSDKELVSRTLQLSNLQYTMGKSQADMSAFLSKTATIAKQQGDRRSYALLNLHLGRLLHLSGQHEEALAVLASGLKEVNDLGDTDIRSEAAVFFGIYYNLQGKFTEALDHFEQAMKAFQQNQPTLIVNPSAPILFAYCAIYLGQFHRAIGSLVANLQLMKKHSNPGLAATIRSVLGTVLILIGRSEEGTLHLETAQQEAIKTGNHLALYLAGGGIAYQHFMKNDMNTSFEIAKKTMAEGSKAGFIDQFTSPWVLEMIAEFETHGLQYLPLNFTQQYARIMKSSNLHLKGVSLRLKASLSKTQPAAKNPLETLNRSMDLLQQSGDPIQLAKTRLEIARLQHEQGNKEDARALAREAWQRLRQDTPFFFPEDLKDLLAKHDIHTDPRQHREQLLKQLLEITDLFSPSNTPSTILSRLLGETSHLFKAERSALIWEKNKQGKPFWLRTAYNLMDNDLIEASFATSLNAIRQTFEKQKPQMIYTTAGNTRCADGPYRSILCFPIIIDQKTKGVLYYSNRYLKGCYDALDSSLLEELSRYFSRLIARALDYICLKEESKKLISEKKLHMEKIDHEEMITRNDRMLKVLSVADQIAESDTSVLIQGESGVGKELLARRIHKKSPRKSKPYIIMDITGISENLLESELFGHEKGAFTGADRQKMGRLELAHQGTLFIDEIGEISKSIQVKLLRALQEKTFVRVGGTQTLTSDFRLVTATNLDLEKEVAWGNFREDLYYRLNVVPITLPPLRDRGNDVLLLAHVFMIEYAKKNYRPCRTLTKKDEKKLLDYHWPGNVRELKNVIERAVILSNSHTLEIDLPAKRKLRSGHPFADDPTFAEIQRRYIQHVLDKTGGKISGPGGATEILNMKRQTLNAKMKKLGLK